MLLPKKVKYRKCNVKFLLKMNNVNDENNKQTNITIETDVPCDNIYIYLPEIAASLESACRKKNNDIRS